MLLGRRRCVHGLAHDGRAFVVQADLPHAKMRSNSLEVVGDVMAVAYQVAAPGLQPAGLEPFTVAGLLFLAVSVPAAFFVRFLERRYGFERT